jgi:hypothetical protein
VLAGAIVAFLAAGATPFVARRMRRGRARRGRAHGGGTDRHTGTMARDLAGLLPAAIAQLRGERTRMTRRSPHRAWIEVDHLAIRSNLAAIRADGAGSRSSRS